MLDLRCVFCPARNRVTDFCYRGSLIKRPYESDDPDQCDDKVLGCMIYYPEGLQYKIEDLKLEVNIKQHTSSHYKQSHSAQQGASL